MPVVHLLTAGRRFELEHAAQYQGHYRETAENPGHGAPCGEARHYQQNRADGIEYDG